MLASRGAAWCSLILWIIAAALTSASAQGLQSAPGAASGPATSVHADIPATAATQAQGSAGGVQDPTQMAGPTLTGTSRPLQVPADPTGAAVYAVLEKHCARCHQGGRLETTAPAGAFGNVLRLDEVSATPSLIQPGNPDASRLYLMMLRRLMPPAHSGSETGNLPTPDEIAHVRSWIAGLSPAAQCQDRRPVTVADHAATLSALPAVTGENRTSLRFLTIAHLYNACTSTEILEAYRQAIVRLFNSLSWKAAPIAVPAVDPARTLFKINLDDLGWLPEHWERIVRSGGSALGLMPPLPQAVRKAYGTETPVARAGWFAQTVLTSPLYYEVLGLPGTGLEILKILHVAPSAEAARGADLRATLERPAFSLQPSQIERRQSRYGPVWQAYHWLAGEDVPDLGDGAVASTETAPRYQAARGMFTLPNGLPAFFMIGQRGDRLDALPPGIAKSRLVARGSVSSGLDCLACHARGPTPHNQLTGSDAASIAAALTADTQAIAAAMRRIGLDPDLTLDGVAPIVALARDYARPVDGARAAAELGVDVAALTDLADRGPDAASVLARRLIQGLVARKEVEAHAFELTAALGRSGFDAPTEPRQHAQHGVIGAVSLDEGGGLILYSNKARYKKGDSLQISVRATTDCHVTIVSVDTRGRGTVLFPSDFEASNLLAAGQELKLPGPGAPYAFRLNQQGHETIVALCNSVGGATDNIRYDFERQRFTELGNYATFLSQNALVDRSQAESAGDRDAQGRGRRHRADAVPEPIARPDQISRTAIRIVVE